MSVDVVEITTTAAVVEIVSEPVDLLEVVEGGPPGAPGTPGPQGPQGPQGPAGPVDLFRYVHSQLIPATEWTITHGLGGFPAVTVVDSAGTRVEGDVSYPSVNEAVVTFAVPFAGQAFLS